MCSGASTTHTGLLGGANRPMIGLTVSSISVFSIATWTDWRPWFTNIFGTEVQPANHVWNLIWVLQVRLPWPCWTISKFFNVIIIIQHHRIIFCSCGLWEAANISPSYTRHQCIFWKYSTEFTWDSPECTGIHRPACPELPAEPEQRLTVPTQCRKPRWSLGVGKGTWRSHADGDIMGI